MRRFLPACCLLFCALALYGAPAAPGLSLDRLPNGLRLFHAASTAAPLVTVRFVIRHGYSYADGPADEGIAHFYEHMLFKANSLTASEEEFNQRITELGAAGVNGTTSSETVTYFLTVPADRLDACLELWAAALIDARFDDPEIIKEISVVSNEIEGNRKLPQRALYHALSEAFFGRELLHRNGHFDTGTVGGFTRERLVAVKERFYAPDNCAVFIGGAVTREQAKTLVEKHFGRWKRLAAAPPEPPLLPALPADLRRVVPGRPNPNTVQLYLFWSGPALGDAAVESHAADALAYLLSRRSGSFLRTITGQAPVFSPESCSFSFWSGRHASRFAFSAEIAAAGRSAEAVHKDIAQVAFMVTNELARLAAGEDHADPAALQAAVSQAVAERRFQAERLPDLLSEAGWWWSVADDDYYAEWLERLQAVTIDEIRGVVQRRLVGRPVLTLAWSHDSLAAALSNAAGTEAPR